MLAMLGEGSGEGGHISGRTRPSSNQGYVLCVIPKSAHAHHMFFFSHHVIFVFEFTALF